MKPQRTISFEFFPPKTTKGAEQLHNTALILAEYNPHFFSVTFGAGGSTRSGTLETVKMLMQKCSVRIAPHLSCVGVSRQQLLEILHEYKSMGVKHIVALRGDLPSGMGCNEGEFKYASKLVSLIRETMGDFFRIDVAAYPEVHPQAENALTDILNLKRKYEAGANSAITQYFFNPDAYFYFLEECEKHHIRIPIIPGIMPISQFDKLARFSDACGAEIPRFIRKRLEAYGDDIESVKAYGLEVVGNLCQRLLEGGAPGLHFYTLNHAEAVVNLLEMLGISAHVLSRADKNSLLLAADVQV